MVTAADLILRVAQFLFGRKDLQEVKEKDQADRLATLLDRIGICLLEAAGRFEKGEDAWEFVGETHQHLRTLERVGIPMLKTGEPLLDLYERLHDAFHTDVFLTCLSTREQLPRDLPDRYGGWYRSTESEVEVENAIKTEIAKIKVAGGAFRGAAAGLRARTLNVIGEVE